MISFRNFALRRGERLLLSDVDLTLHAGWRVGVVGRNGTGKSSLFAALMREIEADKGDLDLPGRVRIASVAQETPSLPDAAIDFVLSGDLPVYAAIQAELTAVAAEDWEAVAEAHHRLEELNGYDASARAGRLLHGLGFAADTQQRAVSTFSGGWRVRLNLARALMTPSDLLLLDEPTNHLDAESVAWLEKTLHDYAGTVMVVTHDRYFLDNVTNWMLEIERGRGYPFEGNYSTWLQQKIKRLRQEEKEESARQRALTAEEEWIQSSPRARQTKNRARIQRYEELQAKSLEQSGGIADIVIPPGPRLGNLVIEAEDLCKGYGNNLLIEGMNFKLPPGGIVGIIGPNGAGKTTLFRMITGQEQPDSGTLRVGETVKLGYVDQSRDSLNPDRTVWQEISEGEEVIYLGKRAIQSRAYVAAFNFKGSDQQKKVGILSGGERNRVHLAKMLKKEHNVILLDEPTNDLDVDTLRALEEALMEFAGCVVVISHDRWFLDRLATHILAFEGDSHVEWFEGNFQAYEADKRRRLGADATEPHRIKYRPLAR